MDGGRHRPDPRERPRPLTGSRAGRRYDADHGITTEALVFLGELDPEAIGAALAHATHYEASPVDDIDRLLDAVSLEPERSTLVDLGAGMGRVVLHASRRPFRQIVGVEVSPALVEIARENRAAYRGPRACSDVRLVCADAATFRFPRGDVVVYLYNPFTAAVLSTVLDRLAHQKGRVAIVYHTPVEAATIDAHPAFVPDGDAGIGRIWRSRREVVPARRILGP